MVTTNGLQNSEFDEIRKRLLRDVETLQNACNSTTGHLGDIVSCLRTCMSSIDLKAKELRQIFEQQKITTPQGGGNK